MPDAREAFLNALNDDLNTPAALGVVWELVRSERSPGDKLATITEFDRVLGLKLA